jgi:hypothetical protein
MTALAVVHLLAVVASAAQIEGRYSSGLWNSWDPWRNRRATQVMRLEPVKDEWPAFALRPYTNTREGDFEGLVLGSIVPGDIARRPSALSMSGQNTWTSMAMQYGGGDLVLTISRLSPAARVDVRGQSVHLFSHLKYERTRRNDRAVVFPRPRYVAYAGEGSKVRVQSAPGRVSGQQMSQNWMLFWFGTDTPYRSSRFPMTTGYLWGIPTPGVYFAHVDVPVLVVFQRRPVTLELFATDAPKPTESFDFDALVPWNGSYQYRPQRPDSAERKPGVTARFDGDAGTLLVMPLQRADQRRARCGKLLIRRERLGALRLAATADEPPAADRQRTARQALQGAGRGAEPARLGADVLRGREDRVGRTGV